MAPQWNFLEKSVAVMAPQWNFLETTEISSGLVKNNQQWEPTML